jgi:hypothetical protein
MRLRAICLALFLVLLAARCGGDEPRPTPTSLPSTPTSLPFATEEPEDESEEEEAEATAEPTPDPPDLTGIQVKDVAPGPDVAFPENTVLMLEVGCTSCDAPARGIRRIYRNKGAVHVDDLFQRPEQARGNNMVYITSIVVSMDGSTVIVAVCVREYCGGMGLPDQAASAVFHVSRDGGVTWVEEPQERALRIFAITPQGWVAGRWSTDDTIWIGDHPVQRPVGAKGVYWGSATVAELLWSAGNRVLRTDGSELVRVDQAENIYGLLLEPGAAPVAGWYARNNVPGYYFTRRDSTGVQVGFRLRDFVLSAVGLDAGRFIIDITALGSAPGRRLAIVDFDAKSVSPIGDIPNVLSGGRNHPIRVYHGPFLRVEAEPGNCLNVYEQPDESSLVVTCAASQVLLRDLLQSAGAGGKNWSQVETLDGRQGWAETAYVKAD